jgi:hypothetical protein
MNIIETLIATRIKGDTWKLLEDDSIHPNLTETLEAYFQLIQKPVEFKLTPFKGELYVISTENEEIIPPKKYNIYGDF